MNYKQKYLKYKNKYLSLKNQIGKGLELENFKNNITIRANLTVIKSLLANNITRNISKSFNQIKKNYNDEQLFNEINMLTTDIPNEANFELVKEIFNRLKNIEYNFELLELGPGIELLLQKLGVEIIKKKLCSIEEFMTIKYPNLICANTHLVEGSCGDPTFFSQLENINPDNNKIMEILDLVELKLEKGKKIRIVIGAIKDNEFVQEGDLTLYISPINTFNSFDLIIDQIKSSNNLESEYKINGYFPTNQFGENKNVLDKIINLTNKFNIKFVNKICGSCFRSMWYLVQNTTKNFIYEVSPGQGLDSADSEGIRTCFK